VSFKRETTVLITPYTVLITPSRRKCHKETGKKQTTERKQPCGEPPERAFAGAEESSLALTLAACTHLNIA
jgi:hypothetical protein